MDDFQYHIRNVLIVMILVMVIYVILAIIYSAAVDYNNANPVATPAVYQIGDVIDNTSDIFTNTVSTFMAIFNGTVHLFGHLLNELATPYSTAPVGTSAVVMDATVAPAAAALPVTTSVLNKIPAALPTTTSVSNKIPLVTSAPATATGTPTPLTTSNIGWFGKKHETFNNMNSQEKRHTKKHTKENFEAVLDNKINNGKSASFTETEDTTTSIIQTPNMNSKSTKWCYIGEMNGERGCVELNGEYDKCPGVLYDDKDTCVSPMNANNTANFLKTKYTKNVKKPRSKIE